MTFQIQYLYDFLNELHGNLPYLTQIELNDRALAAHSCITGMLSSLPPTSIILDYANSHFSYHFENMARYGNGHFSSGLSIYGLAPNCSISCVSTAAGVYALKQVVGAETYQYYFGSAVNHYNRLTTHIYNFKVRSPKNAMYAENSACWAWVPLYMTPNYYLDFVQSHPFYNLSVGEKRILDCLTAFVPRILEQLLLDNHFGYWNNQKTVYFGFKPWCPSLLNDYTNFHLNSIPVEIRNAKTNELIREYVPSISMAGDLLGAKNKYWFQKAVQQRKSITFEPWGISVKVNRLSKAQKSQVSGTL